MELGTVGAVLAFAIKLEAHCAEFYAQAASLVKDSPAGEVFLSLADEKRKRKERVERSRREYMNEMLLEPLTGLQASDHVLDVRPSPDMDTRAASLLATGLEESSQRLYLEAAEKISHLPQMARVFKKLAQENAEHKLRLEPLDDAKGSH
jgi:rubrerythrin